jgi:hypothetical protein
VTRGEWVRPVVLTWLLLAVVSGSLLLRAALTPPPGTVFVGTFYYVDDFYNYLSYVQQAEDGTLVFRNKLAPPGLPPALVNLEWLLVGWLSVLLGGAPLVAYRLLGLVALAGFVVVVDRWLVRGGLPPPRRLPGLLLVFTGGGLGGLLMVVGRIPGSGAYDVLAGIFPFVQTVANPHFVVGTTLLAAALGAFAADRPVWGAALGTVLALVRPYDAALLAGVHGVVVLARWPAREWPRRLLPVAALGPALAYNAWVFLGSPGFRIFSNPVYARSGPSLPELAIAVGPAALLALTSLRTSRVEDDVAGRHRLYLSLWATLAILMVVLRPVSFSLQFISGAGVPLLSLGAIGLGRMRRGALEAAVPLFATTALVVVWLQSSPNPYWSVPADRWRVAKALRPICRTGELVLAPPDIGLYVGGLSPCWPWVSHTASPEHASRDAATRRFYSDPPDARGRFLDTVCASHVVVPRSWPNGGLPLEAPYQYRLEVDGPGGGLAVYSRSAATGDACPTAAP